jgi:hypothetical protein
VNCFTRQTLPTVNKKRFFNNIICISPFAHRNAQEKAALRYRTPQAR